MIVVHRLNPPLNSDDSFRFTHVKDCPFLDNFKGNGCSVYISDQGFTWQPHFISQRAPLRV